MIDGVVFATIVAWRHRDSKGITGPTVPSRWDRSDSGREPQWFDSENRACRTGCLVWVALETAYVDVQTLGTGTAAQPLVSGRAIGPSI